jgi:hypothetical protein
MDASAGPGVAAAKDSKSAPNGEASSERRKEPKTTGIDLTVQQPFWKWQERFRRARVGDFAQYDFPNERITRIQEIAEVGERFVVIRERIMPTNNQRMILMKFDESTVSKPQLPEPESIKIKLDGKELACKRYIYPAPKGGEEMQEVYSDEVPFEGLVGRQSAKGSVHLRRFSRGRE